MNTRSGPLPGIVIIEPKVHRDGRGFFVETFHKERYEQYGLPGTFVQDNHSRSVFGTLRGLHFQWRRPQGKLVRVIEGEVFDVAVDIRRGSPTFGRWFGLTLSAENFLQCFIPEGFAHGFCVTSQTAEVEYKCTDFYDPEGELGIAWNDPTIAIEWPVTSPTLSRRDAMHPAMADVLDRLPVYGAGLPLIQR